MTLKMMRMIVGIMLLLRQTQARELWAAVKAWPYPLPVTDSSLLFPPFFTTNSSIGLPTIHITNDIAKASNITIPLSGTLCFSLYLNTSAELCPDCILLSNQTLGRFQPFNHTSDKGNVTVIQGLAPVKPPNALGPYQPIKLPRYI